MVFVSVSAIFYLILRGKSLNFVEFTDTEIRHQKTTYSWTDVHISVMYRSSLEIPFSFPPVYYVYFNDHYLTREETLTKEILREGFYVELDLKRTELLLQHCKNYIHIIDEMQHPGAKKITVLLEAHNATVPDHQQYRS